MKNHTQTYEVQVSFLIESHTEILITIQYVPKHDAPESSMRESNMAFFLIILSFSKFS